LEPAEPPTRASPWIPFSPLHSEGGIGTGTIPQTPFRDATLSVLYIARVGLERGTTASGRPRARVPFSPLHSEGGIGTRGVVFVPLLPCSPFSPLHSEGGIGTQFVDAPQGGPGTFSPLHSEGGIGTTRRAAESPGTRRAFSPLHSEGGIGTPPSAAGCRAGPPGFQSST